MWLHYVLQAPGSHGTPHCSHTMREQQCHLGLLVASSPEAEHPVIMAPAHHTASWQGGWGQAICRTGDRQHTRIVPSSFTPRIIWLDTRGGWKMVSWKLFHFDSCYLFTMSSYDNSNMLNYLHLNCVFNSLLKLKIKKTSKLCITSLCEGQFKWPVNSPHIGPVMQKWTSLFFWKFFCNV